MEIIIGNSSGMINLCYPVIYLEPILSRLANRDIMLGETSTKKSRNKELNALVSRAEVFNEVIIGKASLTVRELLDIEKGDIIRLNRAADDHAIVSIDKKDLFLAEIGLHRFRKSIKIKELIKTDKDEVKSILQQIEMKRKEKINATLDKDVSKKVI